MSPPEYDASVHLQLGELISGVKNLQESFRRSEDKSDLSRAQMHGRMDAMIERVGKVEATVTGVQEVVKEMKPITDDVRRWKIMGITAITIIGIGGMAMGVTFADVIRRIWTIVLGR